MMETFWVWFAKSPLASALRVFVMIVVSMALADFVATGDISWTNWEAWVIAAMASAVPMLLRWINPADAEFGNGSPSRDRFDVWGEDE